jgi:hypothetical protein
MKELKYTLIADGSSDKILLTIIKWLLDDLYPKLPCQAMFADFRVLPKPPKTLKEKIKSAQDYYPYDLIFIHRDAETTNQESVSQRLNQIKKEIGDSVFSKTICIIPVKMMETWLLIDTEAIKKAAANRNYSNDIILPGIKRLEKENQPKKLLHELLINTSGLKGRNLKKFNINKAVHLVAENITDYSKLRYLDAFRAFEENLKAVVSNFLEQEK